jgi:AcrR family transcriptional regulator
MDPLLARALFPRTDQSPCEPSRATLRRRRENTGLVWGPAHGPRSEPTRCRQTHGRDAHATFPDTGNRSYPWHGFASVPSRRRRSVALHRTPSSLIREHLDYTIIQTTVLVYSIGVKTASEKKPRRRVDPVGTRKAIVEAAIARFSQKGYSGTAMGEVAVAAGVTKSLVQYHFETKELLWQAALTTCMGPFIEAVDRFLASDCSHDDMAGLLRYRFEAFAKRPETIRMLGWAALDPSPLPQVALDRAGRVWGRVAESQALPERQRMLVAMAAIDGWMLMRGLYGAIMGQDMENPELNAVVRETIERTMFGQESAHEAKS